MTRYRTASQWVALSSRAAIRVETGGTNGASSTTSGKASPARQLQPHRPPSASAGGALDAAAMSRISARIRSIHQRLDRSLQQPVRTAPGASIGSER
jgi:hypothetical protein